MPQCVDRLEKESKTGVTSQNNGMIDFYSTAEESDCAGWKLEFSLVFKPINALWQFPDPSQVGAVPPSPIYLLFFIFFILCDNFLRDLSIIDNG